jgi:hypothetical protein
MGEVLSQALLTLYANSQCASCHAPAVGRAISKLHKQQWCLWCWHSLCLSAAPADLHAATAIRDCMATDAERVAAAVEWDQVRNAVVSSCRAQV